MAFHPDKRNRYADAAPWDFAAGTPNAANRTKVEAKTISASRVPDTHEQNEKGEFKLVPGNKTPRDNFRVTTAPKKPESPAVPAAPLHDFSSALAKDSHLPSDSKALNADTAASSSFTLR